MTIAILLLGVAVLSAPAPSVWAQGKRRGDNKAAGKQGKGQGTRQGKKGKPKVFDFTGLDVSGQLRAPQLLYFLDRASQELKRASLERRSFVPEMIRSLDEEAL